LGREKKLASPVKLDRSRISDPNDHFVWGDLIDMCNTKEKFTRNAVYEAFQATIACIQTDTKLWVLKLEDSDGGLFFKMSSKLDITTYEISLVELGGEAVKLVNQVVIKGLIRYRGIDFLPYPPCSPLPKKSFSISSWVLKRLSLK